ncbi:MAG TPA: acyltransferase family protein, partial [Chloroflexia bacterium]|nr:acyltransferase family protein [Chloroflexia bacterium]
RRGLVMLAALAGAAASLLLMAALYVPDLDPSRIYYGTDTRASGLLLGVSLAFLWAPWQPRSPGREWGWARKLLLDLGGLGALAGVIGFFLYLDEFQPFLYQGGFASLGLLTVAAIGLTVHPRARLLPRLLGARLLRWVGLRSYGIYLWHWPIFMVTRPELDVPFDGPPLFILRVAATLAIAELSYRYVETPIRTAGLAGAWRALRARPELNWWDLAARRSATALGLLACIVICASVLSARPPEPPSYLSGDSVEIISSVDMSPGDFGPTFDLTAQPSPETTPPSEATAMSTPTAEAPTAAQQDEVVPSPTETATTLPSATATATATRVPDALTNTGVNLRTGPGKVYPILKVLGKGEPLAVLGKLRGNGSYVVRTSEGIEGWAYSVALTLNINPDDVPVVAAPPVGQPPPAAPTSAPANAAQGNSDPSPTSTHTLAATATPSPAGPPSEAANDKPTEVPADAPAGPPAPAPQPPPPGPPAITPVRITAIGDSVMQGAARELVRVLGAIAPTEVDAAKSRQVSQAINLIRGKRDAGTLGDVVVIHMGTNGTFTAKQFEQMMQLLSGVRKVIFVNLKVPRQWEANNNKVITEGVQRYPNTVIVDWKAASAGQPTLFAKDGIHLQPAGARLYTSLIAAQVQAP